MEMRGMMKTMMVVERLWVIFLLFVCACNGATDYYSLLGLPRSACVRDIKKAFHKLALKHHPDRNHSPDAQQTFTNIAHAYEVLTDEEKRRAYDQQFSGQASERRFSEEQINQDLFASEEELGRKTYFQHFSPNDLLQMFPMDNNFFVGDNAMNYKDLSFIFGLENDGEESLSFSDLFDML